MNVTYGTVTEEARARGETKDCGVRALAVACGVPYDAAHAALKAQGRVDRRGTYHHQLKDAAKALGYRLVRVTVPPKAKTMSSLPTGLREAGMLGPSYIVWVEGHIAAFARGRVEDWTKGRRHRIIALYRVEPLKAA